MDGPSYVFLSLSHHFQHLTDPFYSHSENPSEEFSRLLEESFQVNSSKISTSFLSEASQFSTLTYHELDKFSKNLSFQIQNLKSDSRYFIRLCLPLVFSFLWFYSFFPFSSFFGPSIFFSNFGLVLFLPILLPSYSFSSLFFLSSSFFLTVLVLLLQFLSKGPLNS